MRLSEYLQVLSLNPRFRVERHVEYLRKHVTIANKLDRENFETVHRNFLKTSKKMRGYQWARLLVFILLYLSAIGAIVPALSGLLGPFAQIVGVIGVGVLSLLVLLLNRVIGTVMTDLMIEHAHLVAIAVKHNKRFRVHPVYRYGLFTDYE